MDKALEYILTKFPDHRAKIIDLYNTDEEFCSLCEDYLVSAQAIKDYRENVEKNTGFEIEFMQVYIELETEIVQLLEIKWTSIIYRWLIAPAKS